VSQSSGFRCHNPLCCLSTSVYCCRCCLFRYRLRPETFGYTLVLRYLGILSSYFDKNAQTECFEILTWRRFVMLCTYRRLRRGRRRCRCQWRSSSSDGVETAPDIRQCRDARRPPPPPWRRATSDTCHAVAPLAREFARRSRGPPAQPRHWTSPWKQTHQLCDCWRQLSFGWAGNLVEPIFKISLPLKGLFWLAYTRVHPKKFPA
jgi:hypothetical protein